MGVVDPPNQLPEADPQLPLRDPLSARLHDPLSEFAPEPSARSERLLQLEPLPRERLIEFDPDWRGPGESDRRTEHAIAAAPSVPSGREPKGRWLLATLMLGVGLVAGLAGGVAVVTKYGGSLNEPARSLTSPRVDSETPRAADQPPPPVADRPAGAPAAPPASTDSPLAPAANDPQRMAEANVARQEPEPRILAERAPGERVETVPVATVTGLYVQSSPSGANVYLDDQLVSTTPFQLSDIATGRHTIRIDMQGYRSWSMPVTIEQGVLTKISAVLER